MSQENVEVARKPLRVRERSSRTLDQRLFLRFPRLADAYVRLILRLPPTSRLRQAAVWRAIQLSLEAWNRRDLDATELGRLPDYEFHPARELIEVGLVEPCYRGPGGSREYMSGFSEAWRADARVEPVELIDLGDRLVLLADVPASGRASGVPLTQKFASVITLKHGQAIRQQDYFDHAEALEAVGLRDQAMSRENVELVRRGYEAFAQGDIEGAVAMFHPEIQVEDHDRSLETPSVHHGREGFLNLFTTVNEGFSDVRYTPKDLTAIGDQVLVEVRRRGRGTASGAPVDERQFHVWDVVSGRAVRFRVYLDRERALEAVGLSE